MEQLTKAVVGSYGADIRLGVNIRLIGFISLDRMRISDIVNLVNSTENV